MNFIVRGANRQTGVDVTVTIDADCAESAEHQANDLGILVQAVSPAPSATVSAPWMAPSRGSRAACQLCGSGQLTRTKRYRMSGTVVTIGYILLIPSILGIVTSLLFVALPIVGVGATAGQMRQQSRQALVDAGIPDPIVEKVLNGEQLVADERTSLTEQQARVVLDVQTGQAAAAVGACCGVGLLGLGGIFGAIVSFVGGLLGWLLVMKKRVLECATCGAVFPAS